MKFTNTGSVGEGVNWKMLFIQVNIQVKIQLTNHIGLATPRPHLPDNFGQVQWQVKNQVYRQINPIQNTIFEEIER